MRNFSKGHLAEFAAVLCLVWIQGAGAQTYFVNATEEIGQDFRIFCCGIASAVEDYNNDGWPDLFIAQIFGSRIALLENQQGQRLLNRTTAIQAELPDKWRGGGAFMGDIDNDGDQDLFIPTGRFEAEQAGLNVLLRNDRGIFTDITQKSGLSDELPTDNAIWFDYDRDGDLDLYTGNLAPGSNIFYRNNGGVFEDATEEVGLAVTYSDGETPLGSNGAMGAADFNNDGWPDLYAAVWEDPNRLFLNDGLGGFIDATTAEIGNPDGAFGAGIGDIDNDGDLDLFQAAIHNRAANRSYLLMNLEEAQFIDVTEGVGLQAVAAGFILGVLLEDIDNDGDVDLLTTDWTDFDNPIQLFFVNEGGTFSDQSERTTNAGLGSGVPIDLDGDGFLDVIGTEEFQRNRGNDNHWLRVELVGVKSNRNGIGARLTAVSSELRQIREILSGDGFGHNELAAHFGLGSNTQVDQLEIRWPSGQIDILENIPANQKIRIIEATGEHYPITPTRWTVPPPEAVQDGTSLDLVATVQPALFEPSATITAISADLSSLGGPTPMPLVDQGDGTYQLAATFVVNSDASLAQVSVNIDQSTSLGPYWTQLNWQVSIAAETAIMEAHDSTVPQAFSLKQNHPNPFNSGTTIPFTLPHNESVKLTIHNLSGQQVATLLDGRRQTGTYTLHWDGRDNKGRQLTSGTYLYRLQAGNQTKTRKLLLIK